VDYYYGGGGGAMVRDVHVVKCGMWWKSDDFWAMSCEEPNIPHKYLNQQSTERDAICS